MSHDSSHIPTISISPGRQLPASPWAPLAAPPPVACAGPTAAQLGTSCWMLVEVTPLKNWDDETPKIWKNTIWVDLYPLVTSKLPLKVAVYSEFAIQNCQFFHFCIGWWGQSSAATGPWFLWSLASGDVNRLLLKIAIESSLIFLLPLVIFHSYVSLSEGILNGYNFWYNKWWCSIFVSLPQGSEGWSIRETYGCFLMSYVKPYTWIKIGAQNHKHSNH